jgi:hypothetical protein
MPAGLRARHAPPDSDPVLWAADVVAGIVAKRERGDAADFGRLAPVVTLHRFEPR